MIRSIKTIMRQDREPYRIPRRVQDVIPIQCVWPDGIFKVGIKFSKTYRFTDINYKVAGQEDKETMFRVYSELLNSLDCAATTKLTICNRRQSQADFEQSVLMPMREDGLDKYRREYNQMLMDKATGANGITQEKYVTITVYKRDIEDARAYFTRIGADLTARFAALGSKCVELDATDRLRILHDFYRAGDEGNFHFDMADMARKGHDFKDYICPDGIEKHSDYLKLGDRYCRVLFLKDYANYIQDEIVTNLTDLDRNMMLSIDILNVPTDEAVREVENRLLGVETNITNWQRRQNQNNNFSAIVPYDMELQRRESKEFLADLTTRDQRMMQAVLTLVITADTKQQLDTDTEKIRSLSGRCQLAVLKYQQIDGLNTVLPIGTRKINAFRTLTTESLAVFMPFKVQEIMDRGGIYFGENAISHNLIMCNKANLLNQSSFRLGVPGSGKSFSSKREITNVFLVTEDDVLVCDPEDEYAPLVKRLGGQVVKISPTSTQYVNPMDINLNYSDDDNPLALKVDFLLSFCDIVVGSKDGLQPVEKTVIDRCVRNVYRPYLADPDPARMPILQDLYDELLAQPETEAQRIAAALELYVTGSLNVFNHRTNVELTNRLVCFNIKELGKQLKQLGMLVIQDQVWNRVTVNRAAGKTTRYYVDEFHLLLKGELASWSVEIWKRFRKWGGIPTGITQNIKDLLASREIENIFENSDFIYMLNQAAGDRQILAKQLNISPHQLSYVTHSSEGEGLLFYGNVILPFIDRFPKDTELYRIMTTKPQEVSG